VTAEVRLPTVLRQHAGRQSVVRADGATVGEVLEELISAHPGLSGQVLGADGKTLHRFVNVYLNDDDVRYLERLDTKVSDDDVISILPAVAGGADLPTGLTDCS